MLLLRINSGQKENFVLEKRDLLKGESYGYHKDCNICLIHYKPKGGKSLEEREKEVMIFFLFFFLLFLENAFQVARAGRGYGLGTDYENGTEVT